MKPVSGAILRAIRVPSSAKKAVGASRNAPTARRAISTSRWVKNAESLESFGGAVADKGTNFIDDATEHFAHMRQLHDQGKYEELITKFSQLDRHGVVPTRYSYLWVLEAHAALGETNACVELFEKMRKSNIELMPNHFTAVINSLVPTGRVGLARSLLQDFQAAGFRLHNFVLEPAMSIAETAGDVAAALEFLELLPVPERSVVMYAIAVNTASSCNDPIAALNLWRQAVNRFSQYAGDPASAVVAFSPTATVNALACFINNDYVDGIEEILAFVKKHEQEKTLLDEGTIIRIMESCARASPPRFKLAETLFSKYQSIVGIKAPQEAFSALLLTYANGRLIPLIFEALNQFLPHGYNLHPVVAETIADACGAPVDTQSPDGLLESSFAVLDAIRLKKKPVHIECVNVLILAASRVGSLKHAWRFFQELEKFDLKPNTGSITALLIGAAEAGDMEFAQRAVEAAAAANVEVPPSGHRLVIQSYLTAREYTKAVNLLKQYLSEMKTIPISALIAVVRALVAVHDLGRAMEVAAFAPKKFKTRLEYIISGSEDRLLERPQEPQRPRRPRGPNRPQMNRQSPAPKLKEEPKSE